MTDKEIQQKILNICKESTEKNPIVIFNRIVKNEDILIPVHGPIHHVVDGAAFMTAFFNAGGKINSAKKKTARFLEVKMKQNNPTKKKIAFICVHNSCR